MQVFKLYYKLFIKSTIVQVIIFMVIFVAMAIMFSETSTDSQEKIFNLRQCRVSVIDNDNSVLSKKLEDYIKDNSEYIELDDTSEEALKDSMFFRYTEYILVIPENFGDRFFTDEKIELQTMRIPDSRSGMLIDSMINKYLNTAKIYNEAGIDLEMSLEKIAVDLSEEVNVNFVDGKKNNEIPSFYYFFNYLVYPLTSILIICVSGITLKINEIDIKRRNISSPISTNKFSLGLFWANSSLAVVIYAVFIAVGYVMYSESFSSQGAMLTILNGLVFTIFSLSMSFLISNLAGKHSISAISTFLSLLMCFTGGVFIPQQLLSETLKNVAVINPAFWYVKANDIIGSISVFNAETLKPVVFSMFIQICFALAFLAISLVIIKQKRTSEQ